MAVSIQGLKSYCGEEGFANRQFPLEHLNIWAIGHLGLNVAIFPLRFRKRIWQLSGTSSSGYRRVANFRDIYGSRITGQPLVTPGQVSLEGGMWLGGQQPGVRGLGQAFQDAQHNLYLPEIVSWSRLPV